MNGNSLQFVEQVLPFKDPRWYHSWMAVCCNLHNLSKWVFSLLDIRLSNTPVKMFCPQNNLHVLLFLCKCSMLKCWSAEDWSSVFFLSCKIVEWWVMTKCRFISDMWIHRKTALEVTCIFKNLKVVLIWCERCAYSVNELVDTSCVALIGSESVLPCICLPRAADSYRCVGSVRWNMLELPMFGQSGN
jgi:hypothetical protein